MPSLAEVVAEGFDLAYEAAAELVDFYCEREDPRTVDPKVKQLLRELAADIRSLK